MWHMWHMWHIFKVVVSVVPSRSSMVTGWFADRLVESFLPMVFGPLYRLPYYGVTMNEAPLHILK